MLTVRWSDYRDHILASGCNSGQVLIWDVRRARSCLQTLDMDYISKKSKQVSTDTSKKKAHSGTATGIAFCDDGIHSITFSIQESKMRRWDLASGRNTKTPFQKIQKRPSKIKVCSKFSLSPSYGRQDGVAFVPEGSNVAVIDVSNGSIINRLRGHYNGVSCTYYDDNLDQLFTGAGDRNIFIWDSDREQSSAFDDRFKIDKVERKLKRLRSYSSESS